MANTIISPKQGSNYISIDARGIPYVNYKEGISGMDIEVQRNPVTTVHTAMDFYEEYKNSDNTTANNILSTTLIGLWTILYLMVIIHY